MIFPHRTPFFLPYCFPSSLIWRFSPDQRTVYLTFDDGPVPGPTDFVLETLRSFQCKATFFCIGDNVRKHPDVFARIKADGHTVGNHTFNHVNGWKADNEKYIDNIERCESIIERPATRLFRPPYGRITWKQIDSLKNYKIIMWDVLTVDYEKRLSPANCLSNSLRVTRPGSIVVFHDSFKAEKNMTYALPRYIEHLLKAGYDFKVIE
jgi:peptidoglycan-N-acetylglucosamine deacetylase